MSRFSVDNDLLPTAVVAVGDSNDIHAGGGFLVGRLNLEEMWRMVDRIRVGQRGYASVVTNEGLLLAHGDPDQEITRRSWRQSPLTHPLVGEQLHPRRPDDAGWDRCRTRKMKAKRCLASAGRLREGLGWTIVVEQPRC